ncbi:alpha/beta hydrolase [Phenylobacterium sp.]|uniref:alpha/beta hydrolase n=1 Tax=Phenylobacterium sp. TaxID=1871053 RepID=UPI002CC5088F|nr:alpha/beta fold hydrolase [Phenylobacterium sp.]HLZ75578.1 alpha/beta fold hydrolase [Phenylobacterium sp.]
MLRRLTVWIASLTIGMLVMAMVLASAAHAQATTPAADREVSVDGGRAPLYGALLSPPGARPGPAVLLIAGSGPTDRDGNSAAPSVKPANLKLIAQGLAAAGVTSLRYDKRGLGKSAPAMLQEADLRFTTYVDDAAAFARFLKAQPQVTCVVILGHSEGALIAALAAQKVATCGVIEVSGIGRPLGVVLREQLAAGPMPASLREQSNAALTELEHGRPVANIPGLEAFFRPSVQPYLISQLTLDPTQALAAVKAPVLILQGDNDLQVQVEDAQRLHAARPDARLVILPGVNHILKEAPRDRAGNIATYADPDRPLAPGVMPAILAFVRSAAH